MLAIEGGFTHINVAKTMAEKDPSLVTLKLDSGLTVSNWAQKNGHDVFFKVCFLYLTNQHFYLHFYFTRLSPNWKLSILF